LGAFPTRHRADDDSADLFQPDPGCDRQLSSIHGGLHHHPRRPGQQYALLRAVSVRQRMAVLEDGLCECAGMDSIRHHPRVHGAAIQTRGPLGLLRGRASANAHGSIKMWRAALTHAALIGLGLLMLTPLLWMIGTSLKPDGAEFEYPPRFLS